MERSGGTAVGGEVEPTVRGRGRRGSTARRPWWTPAGGGTPDPARPSYGALPWCSSPSRIRAHSDGSLRHCLLFDIPPSCSGDEGGADEHLRVPDDDDDSDASESDSDAEDGGRRKRRRLSDDAEAEGADPARLFAKLRREYYRLGTFHGKPSGWLMYDLAHALRKNTNELLWLACVALTDQFVHDRITNERCQAAVMELEQHINGSGNLDPSGVGSVVTLKDGTKIRAPEASRIAYEDEPTTRR